VTADDTRRKFQINPGPLEVVPAARRNAWHRLAQDVELDIPSGYRKRWTRTDTARVITAEPSETYDDLAAELVRTSGAIRYRRQAMVHLLRDEAGARARVELYRSDPKMHHKHHDYHQIDELLEDLGIYEMPVSQQFEIAQPLQQPRSSWRGDGTSSALAGVALRQLREEIRRLSRATRDHREQQDGA
jgi:hypothetical protein